ncbi:MAG: DNA double-strand break repair nuclease NurA [Chloroflexi bacterium]|nr:DNA double-strand break repair nuclease NurA [Chloroflexota bacterium]
MTLDLLKVGPQMAEMARASGAYLRGRGPRIEEAQAVLARLAPRWMDLEELAASAERRLPRPQEPLDARHPGIPLPPEHVVIATDGSQIEPDRHAMSDFFLLNVGWAVLRYGPQPFAELASEPTLYFKPEDTAITYSGPHGTRRVPIQDRHLSAKRSVLEITQAATLADRWRDDPIDLAVLADGTLALWVLEERPDDFLRKALVAPYVEQLKRLRALGRPLASYISRPRSQDVVVLLREGGCVGPFGGCSPCGDGGDEPCVFERLPDRELFGLLGPGERSALFQMTLPAGLTEFYEDLVPCFFYLNVGTEIARIEVPPWTADDPDQLALVQSVILDQCQKGLGYPNVLARADKQAVVTAQDRHAFEYLRDAVLAREGIAVRASEKLHSKRVWAV